MEKSRMGLILKKITSIVLAIAFLFSFLSFSGCSYGNSTDPGTKNLISNIVGDDDTQTEGAKTLARPANYDFSTALGDYSTEYYNLYAGYIIKYLCDSSVDSLVTKPQIFAGTHTANFQANYYNFANWGWNITKFGNLKQKTNGNDDYFSSTDQQPTSTSTTGTSGTTTGNEDNFYAYELSALEYVIYMTVLDFDLNRYKLNVTVGNPETTQNSSEGSATGSSAKANVVKNITVSGWGDKDISIDVALAKVKEIYKKYGKYVGLQASDIVTIKDFVKTTIVSTDIIPQSTEKKTDEEKAIIADYTTVVDNVFDMAGKSVKIGNDVTVTQPFMIAQITEFGADGINNAYDDGKQEISFTMPYANYQSVVLYPKEYEIGYELNDLVLCFEYGAEQTEGVTYLDAITIDVTLRYYDSEKGKFATQTFTVEVSKGTNCNGTFYEKDSDPYFTAGATENTSNGGGLYIGQEEESTHTDATLDLSYGDSESNLNKVKLKNKFDKTVGGYALNPVYDPLLPSNGWTKNETYNTWTRAVTAGDDANDYYKMIMVGSENHQEKVYALNEEKYNSDFIEVNFNVHKDTTQTNACYDFRFSVALFYAEDPNEES